MRLAALNLNLLVPLQALLEERNVTRAAERCGVSQPAMSRNLAQLRGLLEDTLLVRTADGVQLTERAERILSPLGHTLGELERVVGDRPAFDPGQTTRRFRIAAPDYLVMLLGPALGRRAAELGSGLSFEFVGMERDRFQRQLETGQLDLAIHACLELPTDIGHTPLIVDRFACAMRDDHPLAGKRLTVKRFASLPHCLIAISDERSPGSVDVALSDLGLKRHVACSTRSFLSAAHFALQSDMILTGPERMLRHYAQHYPLCVFKPPLELHGFDYEATWHRRFEADPGMGWLRSTVAEIADGFEPMPAALSWQAQFGGGGSRRRRELQRRAGTAALI